MDVDLNVNLNTTVVVDGGAFSRATLLRAIGPGDSVEEVKVNVDGGVHVQAHVNVNVIVASGA